MPCAGKAADQVFDGSRPSVGDLGLIGSLVPPRGWRFVRRVGRQGDGLDVSFGSRRNAAARLATRVPSSLSVCSDRSRRCCLSTRQMPLGEELAGTNVAAAAKRRPQASLKGRSKAIRLHSRVGRVAS